MEGNQGNISDGKWRFYGNLLLKIEKLSQKKHSHPELIEGYGGWISINNLP